MPAAPSLRKLQAMLDDTVLGKSEPSTRAILAPGQIPSHRWISFGGEVLALSIDLGEGRYPTPTEIHKFHNIVKLYAPYTKTCMISVTLPNYVYDVPKSDHGRIFLNLVSILNEFTRVARLEVITRMPFENFTQLINASHFYRLDFKDWKLFLKVGSEDLEQIHVGSTIESRLNDWYKVNIAGVP
ncbi:4f0a8a62-283c-4bc4-85c1-57424a17f707 [Sclerotinia trifoliorum]|uniref:4f0a8a62-283c-4bc4-85c1-57424a17f707 n=1 Tax=Sclerotinia trifoliorum TaxID=28548 RepID=A0A8H2VQ61_9HELO|nr:4f0a8a62-283c-4bc4-85c1-57424a17f707 [Sclerotinia trifoliorum]